MGTSMAFEKASYIKTGFATKLLQASAAAWFTVAAVGQTIFFLYCVEIRRCRVHFYYGSIDGAGDFGGSGRAMDAADRTLAARWPRQESGPVRKIKCGQNQTVR